MTSSLRGRLLVAAPGMFDPNFDRTVVLVVAHGDEGALGLVLNRPSETDVTEILPDWEVVATPPARVFVGGPVAPGGAIGLGRAGVDGGPPDWTAVVGPVGVVDLARNPSDNRVDAARVFAGHAGWSPGQLEGEISAGGWLVVDAAPDDAFAAEPERLWRAVLARQRGRLAWFANSPSDPSTN